MSGSGNGKARHFKLVVSEHQAHLLQEQYETAVTAGLGQAFRDNLHTIASRLQTDADTFGEEQYNLHHLKLQIRLGILLPVVVEYGLHKEQSMLFLRRVLFLPPQHKG